MVVTIVVNYLLENFWRQLALALIIWFLIRQYFGVLVLYVGRKLLSTLDHASWVKPVEKDVVYLYQFHRTSTTPNPSPFCIKVEAFLRYHKIKYQNVFTQFQRSREGLLPYIVLNGEEIPDSQLILQRLQEIHEIEPNLSPHEKAIARAVDRTVDNSLANAIFYYKVIYNKDSLFKVLSSLMPYLLAKLSFDRIYELTHHRLSAINFLKLPEPAIRSGLEDDLDALQQLMGEKPFLFGEEPVDADFALLGQLTSIYFTPYNKPIEGMLDEKYPILKNFLTRFLSDLFPEYRLFY
uniref:GST N-terminal domain-containing protein n=1 Tax=Panagrellus redivivus TaxID=6233 RepID=A0A7E4V5U7_PANRE